MARYAFTDAKNICKQIITGDLTEEQLAVFDADYAILFHATARHELLAGDLAQIGWVLVDGVFTDPNSPAIESAP